MLVSRWLHKLDLHQIQYLAKNKFGNTHLTTMQLLSQLKQPRSSQPKTRTDSFLDSALLGQYKGFGLSLVIRGWVEHVYWATQQERIYFFSVLKIQIFQFLLQILPTAAVILPALSSLTPAWCLCRYTYNICFHQSHLMVSEAVSLYRGMIQASTAQWCLDSKAQERHFQKSVLFFLQLFVLPDASVLLHVCLKVSVKNCSCS